MMVVPRRMNFWWAVVFAALGGFMAYAALLALNVVGVILMAGAVVLFGVGTKLCVLITARSVIRSPLWGRPVRISAGEIVGWTAIGFGFGAEFSVQTASGETLPVARASTLIAGPTKVGEIEAEGLERCRRAWDRMAGQAADRPREAANQSETTNDDE